MNDCLLCVRMILCKFALSMLDMKNQNEKNHFNSIPA